MSASAFFPALPAVSRGLLGREVFMKLPEPRKEGMISVESAIIARRSIRSFSSKALTRQQLSRILWAGQGITGREGSMRAAPSAGALYPCFLYAVVGKNGVEDFEEGVYRYDPHASGATRINSRDVRDEIARASHSQMWMAGAPVSIVICADYSRITGKYGQRGIRYAVIETGCISENIFLQVQALNLAAGIVGAFNDGETVRVLGIPSSHDPILIMPVGYRG